MMLKQFQILHCIEYSKMLIRSAEPACCTSRRTPGSTSPAPSISTGFRTLQVQYPGRKVSGTLKVQVLVRLIRTYNIEDVKGTVPRTLKVQDQERKRLSNKYTGRFRYRIQDVVGTVIQNVIGTVQILKVYDSGRYRYREW